MEEQGFILGDVDYDGNIAVVNRHIDSPYEVNYIQGPYEGCNCCYNPQQYQYIDEMKY